MTTVAVLDSMFNIRSRLKELTSRMGLNMVEASNPKQLIAMLETHEDIGLIITEILFTGQDGFDVLKQIRGSAGDVPIMILTSENRRESFVKGIRMGASDYILKPFDDDIVSRHIKTLIGQGHRTAQRVHSMEHADEPVAVTGPVAESVVEGTTINFQYYLRKELAKAAKGNYRVAVLLALLTDANGDSDDTSGGLLAQLSSAIHPILSNVLFETDVFLKYGSQSFVGVFPFCEPENQHLIDEKLHRTFAQFVARHPAWSEIRYLNVFASYPDDGYNQDEIFGALEDRLNEMIVHLKHSV